MFLILPENEAEAGCESWDEGRGLSLGCLTPENGMLIRVLLPPNGRDEISFQISVLVRGLRGTRQKPTLYQAKAGRSLIGARGIPRRLKARLGNQAGIQAAPERSRHRGHS